MISVLPAWRSLIRLNLIAQPRSKSGLLAERLSYGLDYAEAGGRKGPLCGTNLA
jgi:hypothetical protein